MVMHQLKESIQNISVVDSHTGGEPTRVVVDGWPVVEWECCLKHPEQGAAQGAPFIANHIIRPTSYAFDDFAGADVDQAKIDRTLGLKS